MTPRLVALASFSALIVFTACTGEKEGSGSGEGGGATASDIRVSQGVVVEVVLPTVGPLEVRGDYAGEFLPVAEADLASEVSGRITELRARLGDRVRRGQVLASVDRETYQQRLRELQATVQLAQASVEEARVQQENLENEQRRKTPLLEQRLVTEREMEDLQARVLMGAQKIEVARATLAQSEAKLATARSSLEDTQIRAPFAGLIAERFVDVGSYVAPGQLVFRLVDDRAIYLQLQLPEQDAGRVRKGMEVTARVDALNGSELTGRVARVAPALNPSTRTLRVDVAPHGEKAWDGVKPGMYARAQMVLGREAEALSIPNQAIQRARDGSRHVWIVEGGKAIQRSIRLGLRERLRSEVVEGLTPNTAVVLRGQEKLREGAAVVVVGETPAQGAVGPQTRPREARAAAP